MPNNIKSNLKYVKHHDKECRNDIKKYPGTFKTLEIILKIIKYEIVFIAKSPSHLSIIRYFFAFLIGRNRQIKWLFGVKGERECNFFYYF